MNIVSIFGSVFIVTACHPFGLTRNFTQCSPKASRYDHIFCIATPANIDYYSSLGYFLNM